MQHRVKNLFAVASSIVSLTARQETTAEALANTIHARLSALARAHELTTSGWTAGMDETVGGDLLALIETVLAPYSGGNRILVEGDHITFSGHAITNVALLIYELATNAAKYGALSIANGQLAVRIHEGEESIRIEWVETGSTTLPSENASGFGSQLARNLALALNATINREWRPMGLAVTIDLPANLGT